MAKKNEFALFLLNTYHPFANKTEERLRKLEKELERLQELV